MTTATGSRGPGRFFLPLAFLVLIGVLWFAFLRRAADQENAAGPDDGLTYEQRVTPLVVESTRIAESLAGTNSLAAALQAATELRGRWQDARTAAGYDRARHDGFILTFNQFFNVLQSVDLISSVLALPAGPDGGIPEAKRMETQFALQGIHSAETGAQLLDKTGLSMEALLSRTNLVRERESGVRTAIAQQTKARQVLEQLR